MQADEHRVWAVAELHCRKMTPVMQLTDVAVAFLLKKIIEACKAELRRMKRGNKDFEAAAFEDNPNETKSGAEDLMRILGRSWKRMREQDEDEEPERLLKAARMCGWLSYRADPKRKVLIRCDQEDWMRGREQELPEESHRHPSAWWSERYNWINEEGEPRKPDYKNCGRNVRGLQYMRDEFPEQAPNETTRLNCLRGTKKVCLPCFEIADEGFEFSDVAKNLRPAEFLKTQREKFEAARMRAMTNKEGKASKKRRGLLRLDAKTLRAKVRRKLVKQRKKAEIKEFLSEIRSRADEGYSTRQLMSSLIPDIGSELKIAASEVTAALKDHEVAFCGQPPGIIIFDIINGLALLAV